MPIFTNGTITAGQSAMLNGILSIATKGAPVVMVVGAYGFNPFKTARDVVYVVCADRNDITTLQAVYLNGALIATIPSDLDLVLGVLPMVIF